MEEDLTTRGGRESVEYEKLLFPSELEVLETRGEEADPDNHPESFPSF